MDSFIYKQKNGVSSCYRRREVSGLVQFELCGLPTSNYYASALPRSTRRLPLFMELPGKVVWITEALAVGVSFRVLTDELF